MRAQQVPKPVNDARPMPMPMPMPMRVGVIGAATTRVRISHNAQNARVVGLQHIENNHQNATAKDSQSHTLIGAAVPGASPIERATGAARGHS